MKKKIGVYCRVSSLTQKNEGGSIDFQKDKGSNYCIDNDYDFEVYEDVISGDIVNRDGMTVMFSKIYKKELDGFWIYDWNRLIRDKEVGVYFEKMLSDNNDCIVIENNNVKDIVNNYTDRVGYEVNGFISSIFLHNLKKNVKDGSIKKLKDGKVLRKMKMGFSKFKGDVVINEDSIIVEEIFKVFLWKKIKTYNDLTLYINDKFDKKYNNAMIMKWLVYRGYNGEIDQKYLDYKVKTKVPKIIDDKIFQDVQNKIEVIYGKRKGRSKQDFLLKGLVYCGSCGKKMYKYGSTNRLIYKGGKEGVNYKKDRKYVRDFHYYKCSYSDYKKVNETEEEYNIRLNGCSGYKRNSINLSMIDNVIWNQLFKWLGDSDSLKKEFGRKNKEEKLRLGKNKGKRKYYINEIERLKVLKKDTYIDWKGGKIDEDDYNLFNSGFSKEIIENENRLNVIEEYKIVEIDQLVVDDYLEVLKTNLENRKSVGNRFFSIKRLEGESDEKFYKRKNGSLKDMKKEIEKYIRKISVKRIGEEEYSINFDFNIKLFDNDKLILEDKIEKYKNNLLYINLSKVYKWISYVEENLLCIKFRFRYIKVIKKWEMNLYSYQIDFEEVNII